MTEQQMDARPTTGAGASREVSFYPVYQLLSPLLADPSLIPGTPVWAALDDTDPVKWQAILWAAMWWTVAEDARQEAIAEAGEAIWEGGDWSDAARRLMRRREIDALRRAS
ncbi:DUF2742 domain-containing protein [Mycolicibacterium austroafricanum]|uniref:DUF2742 domain-containing protein n=1 Tax=Mycolicibacterium austroafricanum TaxID=39687 RepID=UPI001CA34FC6|nr:DUF2742 domain-containing protein [Mycolicibacterium austroafricanum]QZT56761.1 DUF2742 domain-containing protein [Mycolicibacterium austroafricanum]